MRRVRRAERSGFDLIQEFAPLCRTRCFVGFRLKPHRLNDVVESGNNRRIRNPQPLLDVLYLPARCNEGFDERELIAR
jgi:hypothetical protein